MKRQIRNRCLAVLGVAVFVAAASVGRCIALDMAAEKAYYSNLEKPRAAFLASIGKTTITVFPTVVRRSSIT